jgi:hypothetical protein
MKVIKRSAALAWIALRNSFPKPQLTLVNEVTPHGNVLMI